MSGAEIEMMRIRRNGFKGTRIAAVRPEGGPQRLPVQGRKCKGEQNQEGCGSEAD